MKTMEDVIEMETLYDHHHSYSMVARELNISRNTVKKYLRLLKEVREGVRDEIFPHRVIHSRKRVVTDEIIASIHTILADDLQKQGKKRVTAKAIHQQITESGTKIGYSSVKRIVHMAREASINHTSGK